MSATVSLSLRSSICASARAKSASPLVVYETTRHLFFFLADEAGAYFAREMEADVNCLAVNEVDMELIVGCAKHVTILSLLSQQVVHTFDAGGVLKKKKKTASHW